MNILGNFPPFTNVRSLAPSTRRFRAITWIAVSLSVAGVLQGQDADERRRRATTGAADDQQGRRSTTAGDDQQGRRGNFNPQEMQTRMTNALRERLEITDDEEWKLVSERILKVTELRRATGGGIGGPMGGMFGRGGAGGPGGGTPGGAGGPGGTGGTAEAGRGPTRGGRGGSPNTEMGQLQAAVRDKLPEAEIKVRLAKLRETRKSDEAKLAKAQEDLRAVLTLRQEAVAVVFGLLP